MCLCTVRLRGNLNLLVPEENLSFKYQHIFGRNELRRDKNINLRILFDLAILKAKIKRNIIMTESADNLKF